MNASDNDTPDDDDDRTMFAPKTPPPGRPQSTQAPPPEEDDDRTHFAPMPPRGTAPGGTAGGYPGTVWPPQTQTGAPQDTTRTEPGTSYPPHSGTQHPGTQHPGTQHPGTQHPGGQTGYPPAGPGGGQAGTAYPGGQTGYPAGGRGDTGYPVDQTGFPGGQTGYPADPTGYPGAQTGYPADPGGHPTTEVPYTPTLGREPEPPTQRPVETTTTASNGKLPIGTLINNNYRIDAVLKSGGMGEVYRGIEIHTGDPVAIKAILQEKADDAEAGLMFLREAKTLRQLSDKTIVKYYNYVPDPELQRYFMVMEFIDGVPLKDHIQQNGALSVPEVKTLLGRLAGGLATAHTEQVIHRDLSPDNVMLEGGRVENARLIDFGIAQSSVVKEATMAGRFAGKFKYVAPEQLGHYGGEITPATDIYGLALLTAAAAVGRPLDMGSSIVEAVQSRQSIPDLSFVPEELRPILSYMLEPDPNERPASMLEVKQLVEEPHRIPERYLGGWVPPAPPPLGGPTGSMASGRTVTGTMAPGLQMPGSNGTQVGGNIPGAGTEAPERRGRGGLIAMLLVLALGAGGGGYYYYDQVMFHEGDVDHTNHDPANNPSDPAPPAPAPVAGIPAPQTDTREGFLAAFDTGPCTYVTRVAQGPNAGVIEGYSATRQQYSGLPVAYEERFGARPEVLLREVTPPQCEVLNFARALQGRGRNGIDMFLSADEVESRAGVTAQVTVPGTQAVWMILVSPRGRIIVLTDKLTDPVGNQRSLTFALSLAQDNPAAPQLLLVVETDDPLAHAALAKTQDQASAVLPKILDEIRDRGGAASAAVSYMLLTPAAE